MTTSRFPSLAALSVAALAGCMVPASPPPQYGAAQAQYVPQQQQQPQPQPQPVVVQQQPQPVVVQQQPQPVIVQQHPQPQPVIVQQHPQPVIVQQQALPNYGAPNFGTVALAPGFMPDPRVVTGTSGGALDAASRNSHCDGWISHRPDHYFQATGYFQNLRILASSSADITLVILRPDGTYMCNDDAEGFNPVIRGQFPAGTYGVWIGSYTQGENASYRLGFTERSHVTTSSLGGNVPQPPPHPHLVQQGGSNFGTVSLTPGFVPDPAVSRGMSGGQISAASVNGRCRGWISQQPDHILWAQRHFSHLRVIVRAQADTTLVVAGPNGQVWCDDDSGQGTNPLVAGTFPAGQYRVWVGSYHRNTQSQYAIGFSELSSNNTMSVPAP